MSYQEVQALEHAGRSALAWTPDATETRARLRDLLMAALAAAVVIVTAAFVV
jgi:hypothetical protein